MKNEDHAGQGAHDFDRAIAAARNDGPSAADLNQVAAALGPILDAAPSGAAAGSAVTAKAVGAAALGGALVVGALALWGPGSGQQPLETAPSAVSARVVEATSRAAAPPPPSIEPATEEALPDPEEPEAKSAPPAGREPAPSPRPSTSQEARRPSEAQLLDQARAAIKNDPARALELAREHARLYPRGALAQEREVIAIEALKRAGKSNAARERADEFRQRHPSSIHKNKVEGVVKD